MGIRKLEILNKEMYYMKRGQYAKQKAAKERVEKYGEFIRCATCGKEISVADLTKSQRDRLRMKKPNYCSIACGRKAMSENGKRLMSNPKLKELLRIKAVQRMTTANPSQDREKIAKALATKKKMGWQPIWVSQPDLKGGNGKFTEPQKILWKKLNKVSKGWEMEQPVSLGKKQNGYPSNYKLDIGNAYYRVGIECDGDSHNSAKIKAKDRKKEKKLEELGWRVLRFSNSEILKDSDSIVTQIMSIVST